VNSRYLFYYDGRNLAAMNKANGNNLGTPVNLTLNTELLQGGIIADECDNVYVGSKSGIIKVYRFTGTGFDDNAAPDLAIAGFSNAPVYDLAFDNAKSLLYACGRGFVSAINISSYCASAIYTVTVVPNCPELSVQAGISPALPSGSTISYSLYQGNNLVSTNSNGSFSDLRINTDYMIRAKVDEACGGTQSIKSFNMNNCAVNSPVGAGIYVPGGFTPNNDGLNDILRPVVVGMKEFKYFALYNRWGEQVFRTTDPFKGWDGMIKGIKQGSGVYVWIAEAVDFNDQPVKLKGTTTLIR
jgi:gliding motility-associated-like protein